LGKTKKVGIILNFVINREIVSCTAIGKVHVFGTEWGKKLEKREISIKKPIFSPR